MPDNELIYHLKDIGHFYKGTKVLSIDDLKIEKGSITGLIGPNGSGKTTLLRLLAFVERPESGTIYYRGSPEFPFSPNIRSRVTLLTQKPYLLKRTVFENISYGLKIRKDTEGLKKRVQKVLMDVGLDHKEFALRKWHELSGGEAQRVALAARLVLKPEVLLLDEPTASVDSESANLIRKASLKARHTFGTTLVIASHDLQWLYSVSDCQISLFKGNLFTNGMENIISGPFITPDTVDATMETGQSRVVKKLGHNIVVILSAGHGQETATAVIRKSDIKIVLKKTRDSKNDNQLPGVIVSMLLNKKKGDIMVTVIVSELTFVASIMPDHAENLGLYPGRNVFIKFNSNSVQWI